jgi:adenine-specific DNA-methyltransferase
VATQPKPKRNVRQKIADACNLLAEIGLPKSLLNDRSALTLLALAGLSPQMEWMLASRSFLGITPIMEFIAAKYNIEYAPNSRETFRRQTMHQFVEAGIAEINTDDLTRPVNSPKTVYRLTFDTLELIKQFNKPEWTDKHGKWISAYGRLADRYARHRVMPMMQLRLPNSAIISLSEGGQNELIRKIIEEFCPRFTPDAVPLYIGDAGNKFVHFDKLAIEKIGIQLDSHGKMPDLIIHFTLKNWLILIEAVTSHGPIDSKRRDELKCLFMNSTVPLVYVTAFLTRRAAAKYLTTICWETEVWIADSPSHMIHFNGERFLGPYEN